MFYWQCICGDIFGVFHIQKASTPSLSSLFVGLQAHLDAASLLIKNVYKPLEMVASYKSSQAQKLCSFRDNFENILSKSENSLQQVILQKKIMCHLSPTLTWLLNTTLNTLCHTKINFTVLIPCELTCFEHPENNCQWLVVMLYLDQHCYICSWIYLRLVRHSCWWAGTW